MAAPSLSLLRDPTYASFRGSCPQLQVSFGSAPVRDWSIYNSHEKSPNQIPLICIPGVVTTADSFFYIQSALSSSGYRVISINYPPASSCREWAVNLFECLQFMEIKKCHLFGCDLGGYLTLWFAKAFPELVESIILCNSFVSTDWLGAKLRMQLMLPYFPHFVLKQYALDLFDTAVQDDRIMASLEFVADNMNSLSRASLLSRLLFSISPIQLHDLAGVIQSNITVLQTLDDSFTNIEVYRQMQRLLPRAKFAEMKNGGSFPILSRPEEIILHLRIHLRRFPNTCIENPISRHKAHSSSVVIESTTRREFRRERRHSQPLLFRFDEPRQTQLPLPSAHSAISENAAECNAIPLPPAVFVKKPRNPEREERKKKLFELATSRSSG